MLVSRWWQFRFTPWWATRVQIFAWFDVHVDALLQTTDGFYLRKVKYKGETLARLLLLNTTSEDVIGMWLRAYLELTPWSDRTRICHTLRWPSTSYVCLPYISGINSLTWAALGCCSGSYAMHCCTTCQSRSEEISLGRQWVTPLIMPSRRVVNGLDIGKGIIESVYLSLAHESPGFAI